MDIQYAVVLHDIQDDYSLLLSVRRYLILSGERVYLGNTLNTIPLYPDDVDFAKTVVRQVIDTSKQSDTEYSDEYIDDLLSPLKRLWGLEK